MNECMQCEVNVVRRSASFTTLSVARAHLFTRTCVVVVVVQDSSKRCTLCADLLHTQPGVGKSFQAAKHGIDVLAASIMRLE